jgi:uncharacterized protein
VIEETLLDTGPLVAFLAANEEHHPWAVEIFKKRPPMFLTCEAVLTEACYLLGFRPDAMAHIERFLACGWIQVPFCFSSERELVMRLMRTYQNVPMSFADACLVRMAEIHNGVPVLTLDRDFQVYRKNGRQTIPTFMP